MEFAMFDRHWFGDLALAVLLVMPLPALVSPQAASQLGHPSNPRSATLAAQHLPTGRISLFG
jgi:hypothetical protein